MIVKGALKYHIEYRIQIKLYHHILSLFHQFDNRKVFFFYFLSTDEVNVHFLSFNYQISMELIIFIPKAKEQKGEIHFKY